jgi:acetoin utilization protein AcuB
MLVSERMTANPVVVKPEMPVPDALALMRARKIRRLPVLDAKDRLVGIVSDKDILYASPSPSTSLSVWEIHSLLAQLKVEKIMTKDVVTVLEDTPLEEAARIMADMKIGGLPVMRGNALAGIITETDLFRAFVDLLGGRRQGVRVAARVSGAKGTMARVTQAVFAAGGDIVGLGASDSADPTGKTWEIVLKVQGVQKDGLVLALKPHVIEIVDVRGS